MKKRVAVVLGVLVGLVVLGGILWFNVPRSVDVALVAAVYEDDGDYLGDTTLHISGKWNPDLLGESVSTFKGDIWLDWVAYTDPGVSDIHTNKVTFERIADGVLRGDLLYQMPVTTDWDLCGDAWLWVWDDCVLMRLDDWESGERHYFAAPAQYGDQSLQRLRALGYQLD